jgi:photosystem II stability/assembly factor-like uncharacterized protein
MTSYSRTRIGRIAAINHVILRIVSLVSAAIVSSSYPTHAKDWVLYNPPLTGSQLYDVIFVTPQEGFAVGANGVIVHSSDSGKTWELQQTPVDNPGFLLSIDFVDYDTAYAVGGVFGRTFALMTSDRGRNWKDVSSRFPEGGLRKIHIHNDDIWVTHWNRTPNVSVSKDRCKTWKSDTIGDGSLLSDILFLNDSIGFACGDIGFIGKTIDGGANWFKVSDTLKGVYVEIVYVKDRMYALGLKGQLAISRDTGNSWNYILNFHGIDFHDMTFKQSDSWFMDDGFLIGGTNPNTVVRFRDVSPPNTPIVTSTLPIYSQTSSIAPSGADRNIGVCLNGAIFEIFGIADSCKELTSNTGGDITAMDFYDSLNGICATVKGELLITSNGGQSWAKRALPKEKYVVSITAFAGGRTLAINNDGNRHVSLDFGRTWAVDTNPYYPFDIGNSSTYSRTIFKASNYSTCAYVIKKDSLFVTIDAGKTWQKNGTISINNPDENEYRNFIIAVTFPTIAKGWAVTIGGAVSFTFDTGKTWVPVANISDISANSVYFIDSLHGWISGKKFAVSPTQPVIYVTKDGGKTWQPTQSMHFDPVLDRHTDLPFSAEILKICGKSANSLWALSSEGPLFSSDTGKTWQQQMLPQYGNRFGDLFVGTNGEIFVAGDNSRIWKGTGYTAFVAKPSSKFYGHKSNQFQSQQIDIFDFKGRKIDTYKNGKIQMIKSVKGIYIAKEISPIHKKGQKILLPVN